MRTISTAYGATLWARKSASGPFCCIVPEGPWRLARILVRRDPWHGWIWGYVPTAVDEGDVVVAEEEMEESTV